MMKRLIILVIIITIITIGVVIMSYRYLNLKFEKYIPKDALVDLMFEYPKGWKVVESRGSYGSFIQVQIIEYEKVKKRNLEDRPCSIVVTIYPTSRAKFTPVSAPGLADSIKKMRLALKDSKLVSSSKANIADLEATDERFAYNVFPAVLQVKPKPISIIERILCFQKDDNIYSVRIEEMTKSFDAYNKIFNRILKSIEFRR